MGTRPTIVIVTRATRLAGLRARWGTIRQAKFVLAKAHEHEQLLRSESSAARSKRLKRQPWITQADKSGKAKAATSQNDAAVMSDEPAPEVQITDYLAEENAQDMTLERLRAELDFGLPIKLLDRSYLPNYDFWNTAVVVVVGQDGLVANTAKYVGDLPIVGINPDPGRIDGILVPFQPHEARVLVKRVLDGRERRCLVTLAEVKLNDGQRMLAFNDLFIGPASHISARYVLEVDGQREAQSSSGVLVSTGAGSTGWLSSIVNMSAGISRQLGVQAEGNIRMPWDERRLFWTVREPFASKHSQATLLAGFLNEGHQLIAESLMPEAGIIFSDGIEADFLPFTSGTIARIGVAEQTANLVIG